MTEKLLIGTPFLGISLVAIEELSVYGFSLHLYPFMVRCETRYMDRFTHHKIILGVFSIYFHTTLSHPSLFNIAEKKGSRNDQ